MMPSGFPNQADILNHFSGLFKVFITLTYFQVQDKREAMIKVWTWPEHCSRTVTDPFANLSDFSGA